MAGIYIIYLLVRPQSLATRTRAMNNILLNNIPLLLLNQLVSLLYVVTTFLYGAHFFKDHQAAKKFKQPLLVVTVLTHLAYLGLLISIEGYIITYSTVNLMTMVGVIRFTVE